LAGRMAITTAFASAPKRLACSFSASMAARLIERRLLVFPHGARLGHLPAALASATRLAFGLDCALTVCSACFAAAIRSRLCLGGRVFAVLFRLGECCDAITVRLFSLGDGGQSCSLRSLGKPFFVGRLLPRRAVVPPAPLDVLPRLYGSPRLEYVRCSASAASRAVSSLFRCNSLSLDLGFLSGSFAILSSRSRWMRAASSATQAIQFGLLCLALGSGCEHVGERVARKSDGIVRPCLKFFPVARRHGCKHGCLSRTIRTMGSAPCLGDNPK